MKQVLWIILLLSVASVGQATPPSYLNLQTYLGLTDTQLIHLQQLKEQEDRAVQPISRQIEEKRNDLHILLAGDSPDAMTVGQLQIDIRNLQKQLRTTAAPFLQAAFALLSDEQKSKLVPLANALVLKELAGEAVQLRLLGKP